ncbi:hypothetical protein SNE25_22010 [Mucilaginibacter sabulilitoris]|uniref:Lipocalin-like domain-containing protein n=1 Tax=Mucilaginibacter sabulilitoris TaxID=1173583 RepID=A0ABZ0TFQ2_9SPHI|nr:hypothetical protein [Mucilaginibacter sabulilitoris]WPU91997.1 hypothetical protein SNE25_22010 [Mucilaginibacter sabulilitoris]
MISLKSNFISLSLTVLIGATLITTACKKEKRQVTDPVKTLLGGWNAVPVEANYERRLYFGSDGSFMTAFTYHNNGDVSITSFSGTYFIKGDSLKVTIKETSEQHGNSPAVKTQSNIQLYEKATYSINGSFLMLNYITYPADGPVLTQIKFTRELPD